MYGLEGLTLHEINKDLYRNIKTVRSSQDLFDDLSDDPAEWDAAQQFELSYKPSAYESSQPIIHRPFEESDHFQVIGYPFNHWQSSRFTRGEFGIWYGSDTLETTIAETIYHWRNGLLADAGFDRVDGVVSERRVHLVRCTGSLVNLTSYREAWAFLVADDYAEAQVFGARVRASGQPGLWAPSARCDGVNAVVFTPDILSNPRQFCYLTYTLINGEVVVRR